MWSPFQAHHFHSERQQKLLNKAELQACYELARQLDCSATSSYSLLSQQSGWMPTKPLGSGMDYAESRVYQIGDDTKSINWRLSARSQETFVKTYHMESRPCLCVVLDQRSSMVFGTRSRLKITQATRIAVMLAYAADIHQLALSSIILEAANPRIDDQSVTTFIPQVNKPCRFESGASTIPLNTAFSELQQLPQGSLVYLISDFSDLDQSDQAALVALKASCFVQAIHVMDKAELKLPDMGELHLQDRATAQKFTVNTQKEKLRKAFSETAKSQADGIKTVFTDLAIDYVRLFTDVDDIRQEIIMPLDPF